MKRISLKKRILITGGAGFVGSNLAMYFQQNHPEAEVVVLDKFREGANTNLSLGHFKNLLNFKGEIICADINDHDFIDNLFQRPFDAVFHQAAISDTTCYNQELVLKTNLSSFQHIMNWCVAKKIKLIYASSGATYGNAPSPQTIGNEFPTNVYGFSKWSMDNLSQKYLEQFPDFHAVGLRYFNVYGKNEYFKGNSASMVLQFGLQILSGKSPKLFEGSDQILRDFVYISDVINANIQALNGNAGVYNVGTGKSRSFQDVADILQQQLGTHLGNTYIPNPHLGKYQFHTEANIDTTKKLLGYKPMFTLEEGIADYLPEIKRIYEQEINA